ncbi:MAG: hypothetical protein HY306_13000 [Nitrosomonadales bacterium]|nr:hypothetical protein [Nitrosomonadales bacterium]
MKIPADFGIEAGIRAFAILGWMVRLAVTPDGRQLFYPVFEDPWFAGMVALGIATFLSGVAGTVLLLRRRSLVGYALVMFVLFCVPYMQILPFSTNSLVSDRFLFLAVWPVLLLLVALAWRLKFVFRVMLLLAVALPWIYQTVERPNDWRTAETIEEREFQTYPGHYLPAANKIKRLHDLYGPTREAYQIASNITDPDIKNIMIKQVRVDYAVYFDAAAGNLHEIISLLQDWDSDLRKMPIRAKWNLPLQDPFSSSMWVLESDWLNLAGKFPDDASVQYNAGLWLLDHGRFESAATHLRAAAESSQLSAYERDKAFKGLEIALANGGR